MARKTNIPPDILFGELRYTLSWEQRRSEGSSRNTKWPTGHRSRHHLVPLSIYRITEGKMQQAWIEYDLLGLLQQLGSFRG